MAEFIVSIADQCEDAIDELCRCYACEDLVRCRDCNASRPDPHPERHNQNMVQCRKPGTLTFNELVPLDWYCPDGERRAEDA